MMVFPIRRLARIRRLRGFMGYVPPDLEVKRISTPDEVKVEEVLGHRAKPPSYVGTAIYLSRGFTCRSVSVTNSVTLIQRSQYAWAYIILNASENEAVYIGDENVNTSIGFPIFPKEYFTFVLGEGVELYGISNSSSGVDVRIIEL